MRARPGVKQSRPTWDAYATKISPARTSQGIADHVHSDAPVAATRVLE
jgi:hypothetical protein